jgi:hypothetical protein
MKKFLAIYIDSLSAREKAEHKATDEDKQRNQRGMEAWGNWVMTHANSIVDHGSPIGKTKRASPEGIADTENRIAAYTIVRDCVTNIIGSSSVCDRHPWKCQS